MNKKPLIIICGPTASGKTLTAVNLARHKGEIISADSMQIYKDMDIGTAKPDKKILKIVKHHMIDIMTPDRDFSAHEFRLRADKIIKDIYNRKKIPFVVGGTGLYIRALMFGLSRAPGRDARIRKRLKSLLEKKGLPSLYQKLKKVDPVYADLISCHDPVRIIRALEVFYQTGKPFSQFIKRHRSRSRYHALWIGLTLERKKLYEMIDQRTESMFKKGFVQETEHLLKMGYRPENIRKHGIGYSDIIDYLEKKITLAQAIENVKKKTRRYAKRQMTWFKKERQIEWFREEQFSEIPNRVSRWLKRINFY
ncbi:MAG: tRNA (adenosine(37)-N6)-dimethylallyltransferase MiaA [Spirochaetes bacterium]|nr:tRNA (adenosine(37)-N6)-dimethylallyltransferase MiaA [Spirochaetota bacterium]